VGAVTRKERERRLGARGATLWLTGLSGSGKSTLASAVEQELMVRGRNAYLLDGDNLRTGLNGDLGFERADREENARRVAEVALLFADAGVVAVVALISPYAESRLQARLMHERSGVAFVEVYMAAPSALCSTRDPKGLYAKAGAGEIRAFTGVDAPYEVPEAAELSIAPGCPLSESVASVMLALEHAESTLRPSR
jgi:bifunctional enzyme CysN/CysC